MLSDFQLTHAAFEMWLQADGADNIADLERAKRILPLVLDECVTATQRDYILKYYIDKMTTIEIADFYGVNKSTVSRTIHRGLDKAHGYLRFVSPLFIHTPKKRTPMSNGKKPDNRGGRRTKVSREPDGRREKM